MPDWNRGQLVNRLLSQGHQYLGGSRDLVEDWAQEAVEEILREHTWPWALRQYVGPLPADLPQVRTIEQVLGPDGFPLTPISRGDKRDAYGRSLETGTPEFYWTVGDAFSTFPVSDGEFVVGFYSAWGWLDGDHGNLKETATLNSDVPLMPARDRGMLMLLMREKAKQEAQDFDQAAAIRQSYETLLEEARSSRTQVDELRRVRMVTGEDWA